MRSILAFILLVAATYLPHSAVADRDPEVHQGTFVKLDKLKIKTAEGYPAIFVLRTKGGKTLSFCLDDSSSATKAVLRNPSKFIGRNCVVHTTVSERALEGEFEYGDFVFVTGIRWLD